jgi:preprotein translocase subunit YajC
LEDAFVSSLPLILLVAVLLALIVASRRRYTRARAAQVAQQDRLSVGSEVMTTSGLYGTVVAVNDDDTVELSIAPGVEVKWAKAALRDVASLPDRYRAGQPAVEDKPAHDEPGTDAGA